VLFQDYLVIGSLAISAMGAAMLILDKSKSYQWATRIGVVGLLFPFLYEVALFQPGRFVTFGDRFDLLYHAPLLIISVLNLIFAYSIFVGDLGAKRLAANYALLSLSTLVGAIYVLPALFSFGLSLASSIIFGGAAFTIYRTEREKEMKSDRVLRAVRARGAARLEDIMEDLRMGDAEAESLLYHLWLKDLVEKDAAGVYTIGHREPRSKAE
jgi:hypothetical protein